MNLQKVNLGAVRDIRLIKALKYVFDKNGTVFTYFTKTAISIPMFRSL